MGSGRKHAGWVLALTGVALAFVLGWLVGRRDDDSPPPSATTPVERPDGGLRPEDVELRLDAGGLTLMPDGGLELPRIEPLDGGAADGTTESP